MSHAVVERRRSKFEKETSVFGVEDVVGVEYAFTCLTAGDIASKNFVTTTTSRDSVF